MKIIKVYIAKKCENCGRQIQDGEEYWDSDFGHHSCLNCEPKNQN